MQKIRTTAYRSMPSFIDQQNRRGARSLKMYGPPRDCKGKVIGGDRSAQMYSALMERAAPGHDELRACLPNKSVGRCNLF